MKRTTGRTPAASDNDSAEQSLLPLWLRMEREYNARLRRWSMPLTVSITLLKLHLHPDIAEPAALAEANGIPRQTMTFVLDSLEARGLASRTPHPHDRRRKVVQLSASGRKLAQTLCDELVRLESAALRALGPRQGAALRRLVARFIDMLAAENARTPAP